MKLRTQISLFFILILIFSLGSMTFLSYYQMKSIFSKQLEEKLMNIAVYASEDYLVKDALSNKVLKNKNLNEHIERIRVQTNVDFIVVFDMEGTRFTHPVEENIGKKFKGGDEKRVLTESVKYISEARGTLGVSIRAFAPIYNDGIQVGAVSVGSTLTEVHKETYKKQSSLYPL